MNNHEYFFELINLKIDNTLTAEQKLELDEHLLSCTECADRLRTYELLHDFSDDLLVSPPEGFRSGVIDKIQSEMKVVSPKRRIASRVIPFIGTAAVLALVLYTGVYEYIFPTKSSSPDSAMTKQAVEAYGSENESMQATASMGSDEGGSSEAPDSSLKLWKESVEGDNKTDDADTANDGFLSGSREGLNAISGAMPEKGSNLFDTATAKIGDSVAGFIITSIETEDFNGSRSVTIAFDGETTLSGTLYHDNNELGYWGKFIYFYIDDDCASFLPYPIDDDRPIWFGFDNYDEVVELLDTKPEDEGQTVAYQAAIVIDSYTVVQGPSEGCNFGTLKSILTLDRLED